MTGTGTVAIAVIVHAGRVLLVRPGDPQGSPRWQFPAAAVEPGETVAEAAVREAGQATSMELVARAVLGGQVHPGSGDRLLYVACDLPGHITPAGRTGMAWSTAGELARYVPDGICPSVRPYLDEVLRA
jgi:8-oxo-dGTP diphosphatase